LWSKAAVVISKIPPAFKCPDVGVMPFGKIKWKFHSATVRHVYLACQSGKGGELSINLVLAGSQAPGLSSPTLLDGNPPWLFKHRNRRQAGAKVLLQI